jgi:ubiquitin carboxyl-terminal hydrolase 10
LRSELRVPGLKNSVTLEPYQPLQLDIGAVNVNNIVDALKGLTRPETITGDFNSPRGPGVNATKQVFIESLPPVLILHLKRFQYDSSGGTQKIYKRVGYPLELEIPKEVFPPAKRNTIVLNNKGVLPRYRLVGVVYHHGKNASGGHYTVDVRRQDGHEWIRMDDTVIRRVRPEDVADTGAEENQKLLSKALEQHKLDSPESKSSIWDTIPATDGEEADEEDTKGGWKDAKANGKKWSGVAANGTGSGKNTPVPKEAKDKVAYILFYQEIKP